MIYEWIDDKGYELSTHERQAEFAKKRCWCHTCRPIDYRDPDSVYMRLCPNCGNKRCPRATNHEYACTNSNEPNQPGSKYSVNYSTEWDNWKPNREI
jgi:hypothetical protein